MKILLSVFFMFFVLIHGTVWGEESPKCYFDQSTDFGLVPFWVRFYNNKALLATSEWSFGDGDTSTKKNPVHFFDKQCNGGCYVRLTVTDRDGNSNSCYRIVTAVWILPDFTMNGGGFVSGKTPLEVFFKDKTEVANDYVDCDLATMEGEDCQYFTGWEWDFGDGTTSTERNPVHTYETPDTYTVEMRVWYEPPGDWIYLYRRIKIDSIDAWGILPHAIENTANNSVGNLQVIKLRK